MLPKLNSAHGSETRNIINAAIDSINVQGKSIQDLVAEGQLTEEQYAELLKAINDSVNHEDFKTYKNSTGSVIEALIKRFELQPLDDPIYAKNLWNPNDTTLGNIDAVSGQVSDHALNRVSKYISVFPDQEYTFSRETSGSFKVVFFDAADNVTSGHDWMTSSEGEITLKTTSDTQKMRINVAVSSGSDIHDEVFFAVIGAVIPQGVKDGNTVVYDGGFWENLPSPPLNKNSVNETHIKDGAVTKNKLSEHIKDKVFPKNLVLTNLWDIANTTTGSLSETSGNLNSHATNRVSDFIKIYSGEYYSFQSEKLMKIVFYDASQNFIEGHGWLSSGQTYTFIAPENAEYMRLNMTASSGEDPQTLSFVANIGESIMLPEEEGKIISNSFWEAQPDGVVRKRHIDSSVFDNIESGEAEYSTQPFPKKLKFEEISNGWQEVNHLSRDGEVVFLKQGYSVLQSLDDGETTKTVGEISSVPSIQAVRDLEDGELLVSTTRDEDINLKSKVFKSVGYDRNNPENTQFVEVLEAISSQANIYGSWGLEAQDNICLASEYGMRDVDGARHVYLSTDYGDTWQMIFDQKTTTQDIEGAPTWTTTAHLHTVHYDRYFDRIWLVVGDNPNSATYYSDDMGQTWKYVTGSGNVQYTGIVSFPDGVIFGSDRNPNGIHRWKRTESKDDPVVIEELELINDENVITHVFQRAFRRYAEKGEPAFFPATRISDFSGQYGSVIMSMTGVGGTYNVYELPPEHSGLGFYNVVGITAKGNILTSYHNGTDHTVLRAKAPLYE